MLSLNDFNHIKLLYEQLLKMNTYIKDLINAKDWDSIGFAVRDKEILMDKILKFEKTRTQDIKENEELNETRTRLFNLEKANLELIKKMKEEALEELKGVKKTKKVINAYEPALNRVVSTFEIDTDDID